MPKRKVNSARALSVDIPFRGSRYACAIPNDCATLGDEFYLQVVTIDPCGPTGFALSRGLRIVIGL